MPQNLKGQIRNNVATREQLMDEIQGRSAPRPAAMPAPAPAPAASGALSPEAEAALMRAMMRADTRSEQFPLTPALAERQASPLLKGATDDVIQHNVAQLVKEGRSQEQAVTIALSLAQQK